MSGLTKRSLKQDQRILFSYTRIKTIMTQIDLHEREIKALHDRLNIELEKLQVLFGVAK